MIIKNAYQISKKNHKLRFSFLVMETEIKETEDHIGEFPHRGVMPYLRGVFINRFDLDIFRTYFIELNKSKFIESSKIRFLGRITYIL